MKEKAFRPDLDRGGIRSESPALTPARTKWIAVGLAALVAAGTAANVSGDSFPEPEWASGAMFLSHEFRTDNPTPPPDEFVHPAGATVMLSEVFIDEVFGTGWQDPEGELTTTRAGDTGGAWDLARGEPNAEGRIEIPFRLDDIPEPSTFPGFEVQLFVNLVRWSTLGGIPNYEVVGHTLLDVSLNDSFLESGPGPLDQWSLTTWSSTVTGVMEETMTLVIHGHPDDGTVLDTVQVWADITVIPEPRVYAGIFGLAALCLAVAYRRRSRRTAA